MSDESKDHARQVMSQDARESLAGNDDGQKACLDKESAVEVKTENLTLPPMEAPLSTPDFRPELISDWRLAFFSLALAQGLLFSLFWLFRRLPLPFFLYGQFIPVGIWLLASWLPESVASNWHRLRGASLAMAGLSPFLTWYLRSDGNNYFSVCVLLLLLTLVWLWLETLLLLRETATRIGHQKLIRMLNRSLTVMLYGVLVPVGAGHVALLLLGLSVLGEQGLDLRLIWNTHPRIIGDLMKVLIFWGGCQVFTACMATLLLKSRWTLCLQKTKPVGVNTVT